jgi:hypothetical protein
MTDSLIWFLYWFIAASITGAISGVYLIATVGCPT